MSIIAYHVAHLSAIMVMVLSIGSILTNAERSKKWNILFGVASLAVLVAGFGMLHRLQYTMTAKWILGKLVIWAILAIGVPIIAKRFPQFKSAMLGASALLLIIAVWLAVIKI